MKVSKEANKEQREGGGRRGSNEMRDGGESAESQANGSWGWEMKRNTHAHAHTHTQLWVHLACYCIFSAHNCEV